MSINTSDSEKQLESSAERNKVSDPNIDYSQIESVLSSQVNLFKNEKFANARKASLQKSVKKISSLKRLTHGRNSEDQFIPMTKVKDKSLWKKSNAASSQLRLSEKFRLQGKTDTLDQYTTLPNIRKRMHGQADTFHLLDQSEKQEVLQKARNHLDVTRKNFMKHRK